MRNTILYILLGGIILTACAKDTENVDSQQMNPTNSLDGVWSFRTVGCECLPNRLNNGDFIWSFNNETSVLNIHRTIDNVNQLSITDGNYSYVYTADSVFFNNQGYKYFLNNGNLMMEDMPEADGPSILLIPYVNRSVVNCNEFISALILKDQDFLSQEIHSHCEDLTTFPIEDDTIGHLGNLNTLVFRLEDECSELEASIDCYGCIQTNPPLSEIRFQLDSAGTTIERVIDITTPYEGVLEFYSIH